ncbi:MAG: TIGR00266 family protein [Erysipelotrichaceae bacterium]
MEYKIEGESLPVVIITLNDGEQIVSESGAMSWMSSNMKMDTSTNGGMGKLFGRMMSGDTLMQNNYTAENGSGMIAFASGLPGKIGVFDIEPGKEMILQKGAFLASEKSVELSIFFKKKIGAGLFGGEGFILQKVSGTGKVFTEFDGHVVEYDLKAGESMVVDTGNLAAMSATCSMEIQQVKGVKNVLLGGEGLFNTVVSGPGRVYLQTMPLSGLAGLLIPYMPVGK